MESTKLLPPLALSAIAASLILTSCDDETSLELLPMKAAHHWRYLVDGDGPPKVTKVNIVGRYVEGGVEWFHIEGFLGDFLMLANTRDGVYHTSECDYDNFDHCAPENSPLAQEPLYKWPVTVGDQYGFLDWPETAITVLGKKDVRVPAGEFTCTMYEFDFGDEKVRHCLTPGIGVVWVEEIWHGDVPVTLKLMDRGYTDRAIDDWSEK